jgi:DnaA regulatory inactivator Hda
MPAAPQQTTQQLALDLGHRPAHGRADFLVASSNRDAVAWIDLWPQWPAPCFVLYGPPASGKSHLCAVWQDRAAAVSVDAAQLSALKADEIAALGGHLVLDGIDPWFGDRAAETTLFHLYNILKEEKRTMMVTTRIAPAHAPLALPDFASRLRAAPAAAIAPPDDTLLAAVLVKLFSDRQLQISSETLDYILPRMERSFAAARDLVETADKLSLVEKKGISIPLIRRILLEKDEAP